MRVRSYPEKVFVLVLISRIRFFPGGMIHDFTFWKGRHSQILGMWR